MVKKVEKDTKEQMGFVFGPMNYRLLIIGLVVIILGFILMAGGKSDDPNVFNPEVFSLRRITIAPIVVLAGFIIEGIAIMWKPKKKTD
jgi:membrane-bound ClpP family serine protease